MTNLVDDINLSLIIEQIKHINENVIIEIIDNVITVTNSTNELNSYLLLIFGKLIVK